MRSIVRFRTLAETQAPADICVSASLIYRLEQTNCSSRSDVQRLRILGDRYCNGMRRQIYQRVAQALPFAAEQPGDVA